MKELFQLANCGLRALRHSPELSEIPRVTAQRGTMSCQTEFLWGVGGSLGTGGVP